jgi:outer membrane protein
MRIGKIFFTAFVAILISMPLSAQDLKFGHINIADVVLLMPEYKNISKIMEEETTRLETQFSGMREELTKIEIEYENNYLTYTAEQRVAKEQEYENMQQRVQEFFTNAQQSLQVKQQELQVPVLQKLRDAIEEVGKENGFLYVFEGNSGLTLFQSAQSTDVTSLVKTKLGL